MREGKGELHLTIFETLIVCVCVFSTVCLHRHMTIIVLSIHECSLTEFCIVAIVRHGTSTMGHGRLFKPFHCRSR